MKKLKIGENLMDENSNKLTDVSVEYSEITKKLNSVYQDQQSILDPQVRKLQAQSLPKQASNLNEEN